MKQYTAEKVEGPVALWVHPGADGAFSTRTMERADFRKGEFMRVHIAWNERQRRMRMRLANGSKMLAPAKRNFVVHVAGESITRDVVFEGRPIKVKL